VSTTQHPDDASQAAADAACAVLLEAVARCSAPEEGDNSTGGTSHEASGQQSGQQQDEPQDEAETDLTAATRRALSAAQEAVTTIAFDPAQLAQGLGPPSCTIVTAIVQPGGTTVGWLGDSRAYRLHGEGVVTPITEDHSWATKQVASGAMSLADAHSDPRAHVITRWLGPDAPDLDAPVVTVALEPGDRLLLCSDGLWNYVETPEALAALIAERAPAASAAGLARTLVAYARDCGGHDNITVAVSDQVPSGSPASPSPPADVRA
jgi:serine/threonine protein phosphatase PrpC